jgi:transcriptional regulator with XRE-family HTH domain
MTGLELKIKRIKHGYKQLELARQTGINPTRLSKIENGGERPKAEEIASICQVLKVNSLDFNPPSQIIDK